MSVIMSYCCAMGMASTILPLLIPSSSQAGSSHMESLLSVFQHSFSDLDDFNVNTVNETPFEPW